MDYLDRQIDVEPHLIERIVNKKRLAVSAMLIMLAAIIAITFLLPRKYRADLKVLLKNERVNPIVSSGQDAEGLYYLDEVSEARINTESELMRSRALLREVALRTGLDAQEHARSEEKRTDLAINHLEEKLTIAPIRRSNIIAASYITKDPQQAAVILKTLMEQYLEFHLRLHSAPGMVSVYQQMAANYATERDAAQTKLNEFKMQHTLTSLPDEKALTIQRVADLSKQWSDVQVALKRSQNQGRRLQEVIGSTPAIVEKERRSIPNQMETEQLNVALINLQSKRVEAAARYQPTDRVIRDLDSQIQLTQDALRKAQQNKTEEVSTERNSLHVSVQGDLIKTDIELAGLTQQAREIQTQLITEQKRIVSLDNQTATYDNLTKAVSRLTDLNQTYEKKVYEAQAGELLDKQGVANVAIVEEPRIPSTPVSPKRGLMLLIGTVWSAAFGIALALIVDLKERRIQSPYELELALGAPVVGLIPANAAIPGYDDKTAKIYSSLHRQTVHPAWRLS
ncbi:MAG: hypothetical protein PW789_00195 [Edaphobacter sp.]|uniref:GumC family protein n=1 Tax=Edaphobacter sp. TaxID=1934404 RepID=UPI00239239AB|nr:hypothetical protein [Edaphobacter sp.]MDE1175011.1 hypothetical protein [Edaphobacter sp.]